MIKNLDIKIEPKLSRAIETTLNLHTIHIAVCIVNFLHKVTAFY